MEKRIMPQRLPKREKKQKKSKSARAVQGKEQLKKLLLPQEHVYELKMEKRLKRMLEKEQK
ncbi:MAG: hypothetical protein ACUVT5_00440 [Candidatus Bathyarchaeales archaeon]